MTGFRPPPPYYSAPAAYPAPGTPNQPPGGYAPSGLAGSPSITYTPRPPTPRGAAGQTRKVNIAGNTGPPDHRARGQSYDRALRHRLPGCERPMEDC